MHTMIGDVMRPSPAIPVTATVCRRRIRIPACVHTHRRAPRFWLEFLVIVRWRDESGIREAHTISRDASSNGIYFLLAEAIKDGTAVELEMTLPNEITLAQSVKVRCLGFIQRCKSGGAAAAIERYEFRPGKSAFNLALSSLA